MRPRVHVTDPIPREVEEALARDVELVPTPVGADGVLATLVRRVDDAYLEAAGPGLRIVACGHSAGGHLALWSPGGARPGLGDGAAPARLELEPDEARERHALASSAARPTGADLVLVHGDADDIVPPGQSRAFAAAAADELPGVDHST